jgi:ATP-dependent DNA helicase RecQ
MNNFCSAQVCRHRALSAYFSQNYEASSCNACDVCLSEAPVMAGSSEIARKVIDCVQSLKVPFGVGYLVDVLMGSRSEKIELRKHDQLASYGALTSMGRAEVQRLVFQLVDRGLLHRSPGERPVLTVTPEGRKVQEGVAEAQLTASPVSVKERGTRDEGWQGVDHGLFEALRGLRRAIADERSVPPFVIFGDAVLRDLARQRPVTTAGLRSIRGVGEQKLADFGPRFAELIADYCSEHGLNSAPAGQRPLTPAPVQGSKAQAYRLFEQGHSLDDVAKATGRARSTVSAYLEDFVAERRPESVDAWVQPEVYERVVSVASTQEGSLLRPVFDALEGAASYDEIRIAMRHAGLR